MLDLLKRSQRSLLFSPKGGDFAGKFCPGTLGLLTISKKFPGGCWRLELTDALILIGDEVVSCLYSFHGYDGSDVIFLTCVEEGSKQCENWNDVMPVR